MDKETFYYSILTGQGQKGIDKNTVIYYLNNNPNLKRKGNEFFLKDFCYLFESNYVSFTYSSMVERFLKTVLIWNVARVAHWNGLLNRGCNSPTRSNRVHSAIG